MIEGRAALYTGLECCIEAASSPSARHEGKKGGSVPVGHAFNRRVKRASSMQGAAVPKMPGTPRQ